MKNTGTRSLRRYKYSMPLQRPICAVCNKNHCAINYKRNGITHYRSMCDYCGKNKRTNKKRIANWEKSGYRKKSACDLCGFKCQYMSQMTVFYIDGDLKNTTWTNLKTICLNCIEVVKRKEITWRRGDLTVDF